MSTITHTTTAHIATLANLSLSDDQITKFAPQLDSVLEYTTQAQKIDTTNVIETSQVTGLENILRDDIIDEARIFSQEDALANAKKTHGGYFVVPAVLEED